MKSLTDVITKGLRIKQVCTPSKEIAVNLKWKYIYKLLYTCHIQVRTHFLCVYGCCLGWSARNTIGKMYFPIEWNTAESSMLVSPSPADALPLRTLVRDPPLHPVCYKDLKPFCHSLEERLSRCAHICLKVNEDPFFSHVIKPLSYCQKSRGPKENRLEGLDLWRAASTLALAPWNLSARLHFKWTTNTQIIQHIAGMLG